MKCDGKPRLPIGTDVRGMTIEAAAYIGFGQECPSCGLARIHDHHIHCPDCGKPLPDRTPETATFHNASKPSNPKDAIGSDKIPIHLWPETATIFGAMGLLDGALKYGRSNWRQVGVRCSIYADALRRHAAAYFEGEDDDPDSGLPHLAHMLACCAIIVDAQAAGKLEDDRMLPGGYRKLVTEMTPHVKRLKHLHRNRKPKHYTIQDA